MPGFTGRDRELAALDTLLAAGARGDGRRTGHGIAVISGTAGVGKAALAVHWARTVCAGRSAVVNDQVRHLLPGASGCRIVVTSRNLLTGVVATNGARPLTLDQLGDHQQAITHCRQALAIQQELGDRFARMAYEQALSILIDLDHPDDAAPVRTKLDALDSN